MNHLKWSIGNGLDIEVISQPWLSFNALSKTPALWTIQGSKGIMVADLIN